MKIRQLKINQETDGIHAISFVDFPAIETNFEYFNKETGIETIDTEYQIKFELVSNEKREVQGLVLKSNQPIYRLNTDGLGTPGYIYFSRQTIRDLKEKYGWNRTITYQHNSDVTGQAILLDTWIVENEDIPLEQGRTQWFVRYKIVGDKLWTQVKNGIVKGFSIESLFSRL